MYKDNKKEIKIHTLEELFDLQCEYDLEFNGMSGVYFGYQWYSDDDKNVDVYFKLMED